MPIGVVSFVGGVYMEAVDCEGPDLSFQKIKRVLTNVKPDNFWLYQKILERVKATCFSPDRDFFPDYNQGPDKNAAHFQVCFFVILSFYVTKKL